jgi:hypothetical protein
VTSAEISSIIYQYFASQNVTVLAVTLKTAIKGLPALAMLDPGSSSWNLDMNLYFATLFGSVLVMVRNDTVVCLFQSPWS